MTTLTAVFQEVPEGYIAFVEELPGANNSLDELLEKVTKDNLHPEIDFGAPRGIEF